MQEFQKGQHLVTRKLGYSHHGLYIGDNKVIHYSGLSKGFRSGPVEIVDLDIFSDETMIRVKAHENPKYTPEEIVDRAMTRVGEDSYHVFNNNCEHFINWCIYDNHHSQQVKNGKKALAMSAAFIAFKVGKFILKRRK